MLARILKPRLREIQEAITVNTEFRASAKTSNIVFALKSHLDEEQLIICVQSGAISFPSTAATITFTLSARDSDWTSFFTATPQAPFQSYWGILRTYGTEPGVAVLGVRAAFAKSARIWRLFLEVARKIITGTLTSPSSQPSTAGLNEEEEDPIIGRYLWTHTALWGTHRIFYETSGTGPQSIIFLHTAGSDSRQFHTLLRHPTMRKLCTMTAFDLPGHGRSDLGSLQVPEALTCDEDSYISVIGQVIHKLRLQRLIVCGASMAGQICLAVALRATELNISGVIPCEACEHIPDYPSIYEHGANESVLGPETVCGMMAPSSPEDCKRLVWWSYSSQGAGVFKGDLTFYFRGWDGRGRIEVIDTLRCPVYMLTGEYDYSCTPEMSRQTAAKIPGATFEVMKGLGHFPATEDPLRFLEYLIRGVEYIQERAAR